MQATTVGAGPFKPAIRFNGEMFIQNIPYIDEDEALKQAQRMYEKFLSNVREILRTEGFVVT